MTYSSCSITIDPKLLWSRCQHTLAVRYKLANHLSSPLIVSWTSSSTMKFMTYGYNGWAHCKYIYRRTENYYGWSNIRLYEDPRGRWEIHDFRSKRLQRIYKTPFWSQLGLGCQLQTSEREEPQVSQHDNKHRRLQPATIELVWKCLAFCQVLCV